MEALVAGADADARFPALAVHTRACPACRQDLDGLLEALRALGDEPFA